ncbi:hypothetical protein M0805_002585 [Coniferiporia weirii]|nr:hypothetical protein M0805_002585 [Coniferiporia weirii]
MSSKYAQKRKRKAARGPVQPEIELQWLAPTESSRRDRGPVSEDTEGDAWDWSALAPQRAQAQSLCIEAHEADVVCGQEATALMLETPSSGSGAPARGGRGAGLIRQDLYNGERGEIWVDRYDARLLLAAPLTFTFPNAPETTPPSPSGWSDLPSDTEDTFFFAPAEIAAMRYAKRRRLLDDARTVRLRALGAPGDNQNNPAGVDGEDEDARGASDEEPPAETRALMMRTATHLIVARDSTQLTARILANHGGDSRFAFLRGRWRRAWAAVRAEARELEKQKSENEKKAKSTGSEAGTLTGLGGYGDSDSDDETECKDEQEVNKEEGINTHVPVAGPPSSSTNIEDEAAKIQARRARARDWAAKRREEKNEKTVE